MGSGGAGRGAGSDRSDLVRTVAGNRMRSGSSLTRRRDAGVVSHCEKSGVYSGTIVPELEYLGSYRGPPQTKIIGAKFTRTEDINYD